MVSTLSTWVLLSLTNLCIPYSSVAVLLLYASLLRISGHCDNPPGDLIATAVSVDSQQEFALHVALHPSCTTAYYITNAGAKKLTEYLRVPQEAVDDHLVELVVALELFW